MQAPKRYTARVEREQGTASVTLTAEPTIESTTVTLAPEVEERLRVFFDEQIEQGRHFVVSGITVQIAIANGAGEMPRVGGTAFRVEVVGIELDRQQESGSLLTIAAMNAIAEFLVEFESL